MLRQFSIDQAGRNIFVYDKIVRRSFPSPIGDAAAERDFYEVTVAGRSINYEPLFRRLDDRLASVLKALTEAGDLAHAPTDIIPDLRILAACQLLRTQLQRTTPIDLANQLAALSLEVGIAIDSALADADARLIHLRRLLNLDAVAGLFEDKDIVLLRAPTSASDFWLSDNPIVFNNSFPYGDVGLTSPGVEVYFPFGPRQCVAFLCPSIGKQLRESFHPDHPRPPLKDPFYANMLRGIDSLLAVPADQGVVDFLNSLQVAQSSRFVYAAQDAFALAETMVSRSPELATVSSLLHFGRLGEGPPLRTRMPPGEYLVIEAGHNHHALAIEDLTDRLRCPGIAFTTTDHLKLAYIEADAPFDSVTLYRDGQATRMLQQVVFRPTIRDGLEYVEVRHSDDATNTLMEIIGR